jgi:hypothetical protein
MKAIIEVELGNAAFGEHDADMRYELRCVLERLIDNADRIRVTSAGDFATASDTNGNSVAKLKIV